MKRIFTYLAGFSLLFVVSISCRKEGHDEKMQIREQSQLVNAVVPSGQTYVYSVIAGSSVSINKQASHYQVSETTPASDGSISYTYVPLKGYTGADEVTLTQTILSTVHGGSCSGHGGGESVTTVNTIVIKFDVAN